MGASVEDLIRTWALDYAKELLAKNRGKSDNTGIYFGIGLKAVCLYLCRMDHDEARKLYNETKQYVTDKLGFLE